MEQSYDFYIGDIHLPITPKKLDIKTKNQNETIRLLNGEELNLLNKPGLTEFSFDFRLPSEEFPAVTEFIAPYDVISRLNEYKEWKDEAEGLFSFIVIRYGDGLQNSTNTLATLEDYDVAEDAENGKDIIVSVKLKKYVPQITETMVTKEKDNKLVATVEKVWNMPMKAPTRAKVTAGMTLSLMAKKHLGDSSRWKEIAKKNNITNPNLLKIGQVLKL